MLLTGVLHGLLGTRSVAEGEKRSHLMSDHMLLGASLTAILATEIGLGLLDLKRALEQKSLEAFRLFSVLAGKLQLLKGYERSVHLFLSNACVNCRSRCLHVTAALLQRPIYVYFLDLLKECSSFFN